MSSDLSKRGNKLSASLFFPLALACLFFAVPAKAQTSRLYFAGYSGLSIHFDNDFEYHPTQQAGDYEADNAFTMAGALGLRFNRQWRIEGEISYTKSALSRIDIETANSSFDIGGNISSLLLMANLYYDIDYRWRNLQPYVTAGLGTALLDVTMRDTSGLLPDAIGDTMEFAWQVGTGLKYRLRPDLAFTGHYRYIGTSDLQIRQFNLDYSAHELRLGVEYDIPYSTVERLFSP